MKQRHRIFIAINLPGDVKKYLAGFEKKFSGLPAKWTPQENLHITLLFLGDLTDEELGEVCLAVKGVAQKHESFNLILNKVAYGPENKIPPRYVWVGGEKSPEAILLKNDLEDALLNLVSFAPDTKAFSLHITLAKINGWEWRAIEPEERTEISEIIEMPFTVESIEVMESESLRGNLRYNIIESHQLL